jgi:hypothetical protein
MKITSKLAIPLLMLPLAGSAWADATQTAPGAAHGVGSGHAATSATAQPDKSGNIGAGQTGVGGTANGRSAAGAGTQPGAGGMQPRIEQGDGEASAHGRSTSGNAQGL